MLPIISEYDKEIMKQGIQQEFRRILNLMIEIETRDKFEPFINKWIDLKQKLQSQETESSRVANHSIGSSPDTQSLQIIDNWLKSYQEDIFLKISDENFKKINKALINIDVPLDRLSAHILRDALIKIKGEIENGKNK